MEVRNHSCDNVTVCIVSYPFAVRVRDRPSVQYPAEPDHCEEERASWPMGRSGAIVPIEIG